MAIDLTDKAPSGITLSNSGAAESASVPFATDNTVAVDLELSESDYLSATNPASLRFTGNHTLECWVNFESTPAESAYMCFMGKFATAGNQRSYLFALHNNAGTLRLVHLLSSNGTAVSTAAANWTPSTSTYYHAAVAYSTAGEAQFYVNGGTQGTLVMGLATSIYNSTSDFTVGEANAANYLDGLMDEVRAYSVTRSAAQIASDYNQQITGGEAGLVGYWPFNPLPVSSYMDLTSKKW